jgi:Tfp pilus assembly protein PilF
MRSKITWVPRFGIGCGLGLALALTLACAKGKGQTESPDELELPPEKRVADKANKQRDREQQVAKKVEPAKPAVVHPQDRDPNQEKAKMKRSRDKSAKAKQKLRAGQLDAAITEARNALRDHEQNVEAMLVIAEAFYRQGKHELVLSVTGSILKVDAKVLAAEEKSQAYNLMGFAYLQAGLRGNAHTAFKNAAETDEHNAAAWNNLGISYMWRGETQLAENCFEYAASLDAKFPDVQLNWGAALRANGKLAEAEVAYREAIKLRPDWAEPHFNLGVLYLDAEQLPKLDEIAKLEAAVAAFQKYKSLAGAGKTSLERSSKKARGASDAMGNELVSIAQADLYIKAANKSIESEKRRIEREQSRKQAAAKSSDEPAGDPPSAPDAEQPSSEAPAQPQPTPPPPEQPKKPGEGDKSAPQQPQKPGGSDKPAAPPKTPDDKPKLQKPG